MGTEVHHHLLVSSAKDPGVCESGHARTDFDRDTAGVVENAVFETPSVGIPDPIGQRAVDECGPKEGEDHARDDTASLGDGSDSKGGGDSTEHHLVERIKQSRDER